MKTGNFIYCCAAIVLFFSTVENLNAQWQTLGNNVYYNNGNVGIGTSNPQFKLHVKDKIFIEYQDIVENWMASYLQWSGHRLIMGSPLDQHYHNSVELRPGGSNQGLIHSELRLYTAPSRGQNELNVLIHSNGPSFFNGGNVGIGTSNPTSKLTVAGDIRAREILVDANAGADFVFADDYSLRPLNEVETFIKDNRHLPDISPADSMVQNGVNMGEMQIKLLQKIEELTLSVIELEKKNEAQQKAYHLEIEALKNEIDKIKDDE